MTSNSERVTIAEGGRVVIPARFRRALGLCTGDRVIMRLEGEELRVHTVRQGIRYAQARVAQYITSDGTLVDQFIADRHAEAERE